MVDYFDHRSAVGGLSAFHGPGGGGLGRIQLRAARPDHAHIWFLARDASFPTKPKWDGPRVWSGAGSLRAIRCVSTRSFGMTKPNSPKPRRLIPQRHRRARAELFRGSLDAGLWHPDGIPDGTNFAGSAWIVMYAFALNSLIRVELSISASW